MKERFVSILKNPFFQGGIFLTLSGQVTNFFNYLFNFLAARALGPNGYGEITSLLSYLTIVSVPLSIVAVILTQKIGSQDEKKLAFTKALEIWFWQKIKYWGFIFLIIFIITPFLPRITNLSLESSIGLVLLFLFSVIGIFYTTTIQALQLFLAFSIVAILTALVKLIGGLLAWLQFGQTNTVIAFLVMSMITTFLGSFYIYRKAINKQKKMITFAPLEKRLRNVIKSEYLIITTLSVLAMTLLSNADIIVVKKFSSAFDAGIYSSWSLFAKIILYVIGPFVSLSFVFFSSKKNVNKQNTVLTVSLILLVFIGIFSYMIYSFFPQIITQVLFGNKFKAVVPYLTQAAVFGTLYTSILLLNSYFLAKKSRVVLTLPVVILFYLAGLLILKGNFQSIMAFNIFISSVIAGIYIFSFFWGVSRHKKGD